MRYLLVLLLAAIFCAPLAHAARFSDRWYRWLDDYPWPARYVIVAAGDYQWLVERAHKWNIEKDQKGNTEDRDYEEFFDPVFPFKGEPFADQEKGLYEYDFNTYGQFGFLVIEFDRRGRVLTQNRSPQSLTARQTIDGERRRVSLLVAGEGKPGDYWYMLGVWFDGFPSGDGGDFSPALCHRHRDDGRYTKNSSEAYFHPERKFDRKKVEEDIGLFGCREWTYQLYRRPLAMGLQEHPPGPPYIDVTSYGGKRGEKTRIGDFLGWARFEDPVRPVIGKHGKYWVCLHECPDGEKPGLIPDIREWTGKRGWPLPKPTPTFPDSKFKNPYKPENPD